MVDKIQIPRHPTGEIEKALQVAREAGWLALEHSPGHFANIVCPHGHKDCWAGVWSTAANDGSHAKAIRRAVERCPGAE